MTKKELIERLQEFPDNMIVTIDTRDWNYEPVLEIFKTEGYISTNDDYLKLEIIVLKS